MTTSTTSLTNSLLSAEIRFDRGPRDLCDLWSALVPSKLWQESEGLRQISRVAAFCAVMLFWICVFAPMYAVLGASQCALVIASGGALLLAILAALQRGYSPKVCGHSLCAAGILVYAGIVLLNGGQDTPAMIWYVSIPLLSLAICGPVTAFVWTIVSILAVFGLKLADQLGYSVPSVLNHTEYVFLELAGAVSLLLCFFTLQYVSLRFEQQAREALREQNRNLEIRASMDALTGISNRGYFDLVFEYEWRRHGRDQMPLSVALIDIDFFKSYNDTQGHVAGDNALRAIARAIESGARRTVDTVARYGGEEFAVILPNTDEHQIGVVVEQILGHVRQQNIRHPSSQVAKQMTISIGTATVVPDIEESQLDLLRQADEALYEAKANGRNRWVQSGRILVTT